MSVQINNNYGAIAARKHLNNAQKTMNTSFERMSTGKKTINASDDAAGVAIAGKMEAQIRALTTAASHAKTGQLMVATAEGSLAGVNNILQNMRELTVNAASGTASDSDKDFLNVEMSNLVAQIEATSVNSKYNNIPLLDGTQFTFFTDMDVSSTSITTAAADMSVNALGVNASTVDIGSGVSQSSLGAVIVAIDSALASVNELRASFGAISNRFDHTVDNMLSVISNTEKSKSVLIDADFAIESAQLTKGTVLQSAATSMMAQANAQKNGILTLMRT